MANLFVDKAQIFIRSGKGGNGAVSFRREPYVPQGGPDGGNGGKGGDVVFLADRNLRTRMDFRYKRKYQAENGEDGRGKKQYGKDGEDLVIKVPMGTVLRDVESGAVMADLKEDGQRFVAAKGGKGGKGNDFFKNSVRQAPNFAESGGFATEKTVELDPNVGKSTLLSVSTSATPKIANYHFTTITPNLGVVTMFDDSFVMADIPGLIEGASAGSGLGLEFLKHIERTRILVHVIDAAGSEGRDPKDDLDKINAELASYSEKLLKKPQIIAANKTDLVYDREAFDAFVEYAKEKGYDVYPVSAATHQGIEELLKAVYKLLAETEEEELVTAEISYETRSPEEEAGYRDVVCGRDGKVFTVSGKQLEKIFNSTNFNDAGSLRYLYRYVENSGAIDQLLAMGMEEGDTIRIFDYEFEYIEE